MRASLRFCLVAILFITGGSFCFAQTTEPSGSEVSAADVAALKAKVDGCQKVLDAARRECVARLAENDDYKAAVQSLKDAQADFDAAADSEATMKAANDKLAAKKKISDLTADALKNDPVVAKCTEDKAAAEQQYQTAETARDEAVAVQQKQAEAQLEKEKQEQIEKSTPEITAAQLETLGERYVKMSVKMTNAQFDSADNTFVDELPGVTVEDNGLEEIIDMRERNLWIGFSVADSNGRSFNYCYALKSHYGDMVAGMKAGATVNLRGVVVELTQAGEYGLICTSVEVASQPRQ